MANKSISMQQTRQVLRLRSQGKGIKAISSSLGVARNTVKKYLQVFYSSGLDYESFFKMSDSELSSMFHVSEKQTSKPQRLVDLESMLPEISKQLKRKGVTREQLHKEVSDQVSGWLWSFALQQLHFPIHRANSSHHAH